MTVLEKDIGSWELYMIASVLLCIRLCTALCKQKSMKMPTSSFFFSLFRSFAILYTVRSTYVTFFCTSISFLAIHINFFFKLDFHLIYELAGTTKHATSLA